MKLQMSTSLLCFCMLILGAISLFFGYVEPAIYCNTFVFALQSILIGQQLILGNRNKRKE